MPTFRTTSDVNATANIKIARQNSGKKLFLEGLERSAALSFSLEDLDLVSVLWSCWTERLGSLSFELRASQHCKLEMSEHGGGQDIWTRVSLKGNHLH